MIQLNLSWENFKRAIARHQFVVYYAEIATSYQLYGSTAVAEYSAIIARKDGSANAAEFEERYKPTATPLV